MIDAVEFVGPGTDIALGLYRVAQFYYYPGFNKPNGTGECIVSLKAWDALDAELRRSSSHACAAEASYALAEMERLNTEALAALTGQHSVKLRAFPKDLIAAARKQSVDVLAEMALDQRNREENPRLLRRLPRPHRRMVAHFDQGVLESREA